jgi:putative FmdB family regulatory protein
MPLYEYRCSKCDKKFEVIQKFADEPLTLHPDCGGPVERLLSAPSFQLKGTGWYATDYAKSGAKSADPSAETKSADTKTAEAKSSDSKTGETKTGESKTTEPKAGESKTSESKPESKPESKSDSKPAASKNSD